MIQLPKSVGFDWGDLKLVYQKSIPNSVNIGFTIIAISQQPAAISTLVH